MFKSGTERAGWWVLTVICAFYGLFALSSGVVELLFLLGARAEEKHRALPVIFTLHALSGAVALLLIPAQLHPQVRAKLELHRKLGRVYGGGVLVAGFLAIADAPTFDVPSGARLALALVAFAWILVTTIAVVYAWRGGIALHREWVVRSVALTLFFVSFSFWVPGLLGSGVAPPLAWPLGVGLSAAVNLAVAEWWLHRRRGGAIASGARPLLYDTK